MTCCEIAVAMLSLSREPVCGRLARGFLFWRSGGEPASRGFCRTRPRAGGRGLFCSSGPRLACGVMSGGTDPAVKPFTPPSISISLTGGEAMREFEKSGFVMGEIRCGETRFGELFGLKVRISVLASIWVVWGIWGGSGYWAFFSRGGAVVWRTVVVV